VSLGFLNYDMSRTHSIMRIATTASPVSGAEVTRPARPGRARTALARRPSSVFCASACV
jgi:hypothetical protein